VGAGEPSVC